MTLAAWPLVATSGVLKPAPDLEPVAEVVEAPHSHIDVLLGAFSATPVLCYKRPVTDTKATSSKPSI